jgi:AcrR family transcriptional regulator
MARPADPHRREEILQAATEVFIEQGYSEARRAAIGRRAGVVISTLYLYFDSKETMVRAIAQQIRQELLDQLLPIIEHLTSQADIERLVEIIAAFAANHRDQIHILYLDSGLRGIRNTAALHHWRSASSRQGPRVQQAIQAIEKQIEEGSLYPYKPALVIEMILSFLRWFVRSYSILEEETEEIAELKAFGVQWLGHALLPPQ